MSYHSFLFVISALTITCSIQLSPIDQSTSSNPSITTSEAKEADTDKDLIDNKQARVCRYQQNHPSSTSGLSLFSYESDTGSAQAYKPNAPIKNSVCEAINPATKRRYDHKVANRWLPWRSSQKSPSPVVKVYGRLLDKDVERSCNSNGLVFVSENDESAHVEVWQALPDGTYSSLSSSDIMDDGMCRARVPLVPTASLLSHPNPPFSNGDKSLILPSSFAFETLVPGVTGTLGGLGPRGWDIPPWKIPVIHVLISLDGFDLSLIEIPISKVRGTKAGNNDNSSDDSEYTIYERSFNWGKASFHWNTNEDELKITVDINIRRKKIDGFNGVRGDVDVGISPTKNHERHEAALISSLCQLHKKYSWWYPSSPKSFFMEPIALCRPFILDFFPL